MDIVKSRENVKMVAKIVRAEKKCLQSISTIDIIQIGNNSKDEGVDANPLFRFVSIQYFHGG